MKKFLSLFLAMFLTLGMVGCGDRSAQEPTYSSDEKFDIGMWVGISDKLVTYNEDGEAESSRMLTDEEFLEKYQEIADSGINIAFPGYDVMIDGGTYNLKALKAAHTVGIKQIIGDNTLRNELMQAKTLVEAGIKTEAQMVERVEEIIRPYTSSEYSSALCGFMIQDEPGANKFAALAYAEKIFKQAAPDLMFYVNLFPIIAGGSQLSGTDTPITYDSYLSQWFATSKADYVSYDHYPLYSDGINYSLESSFLYNMDLIKTKVEEENKDRSFWTFLQSIQFGGRNRALESIADASFQAYSFLAFGGDGIQWFCYACPPENDGATYFGNNAMVDRNYEKTATYGYVQATNGYIQALMPYYKNFDWKGFMVSDVYDDSGNFAYLENSGNLISDNKTLKNFESTEDAFAGVFEDKDGRQGFMVVNFTDPALNRNNTVTLTLEDAKNAIVVKNGVKSVEKVKKGKLVLEMSAGDGIFVIPY